MIATVARLKSGNNLLWAAKLIFRCATPEIAGLPSQTHTLGEESFLTLPRAKLPIENIISAFELCQEVFTSLHAEQLPYPRRRLQNFLHNGEQDGSSVRKSAPEHETRRILRCSFVGVLPQWLYSCDYISAVTSHLELWSCKHIVFCGGFVA